MRDCSAALWPCAMTGAVSCLTGLEGIGVIIHGASGCYFYPATVLRRKIHCTFLVEEDIIFGAGERLRELVGTLGQIHDTVAVVNTCTPAIIGERLEDMEGGPSVIVIDSPGFLGSYEEGFLAACRALPVEINPGHPGVLIDGLSPLDPFYSGNCLETLRLLRQGGAMAPVLFSACPYSHLSHLPAPVITTNPDLHAGFGDLGGDLLGIDETVRSLSFLEDISDNFSCEQVEREAEISKEEITRVCDKFLQRHDPPNVGIFGGTAYACFAAALLEEALDASIICIGSRNPAALDSLPVTGATTIDQVRDLLECGRPDLILGSSFERSIAPGAAFIPFTFPIRGLVRLRPRPLIGIQGTLGLIEDVLNALLDR
ncbi:MAG: oxidoreductase [Methanoregulaceae archaeon]|nr:oxidoreductase [Methanoregulaceae archaeon]